MLLHYLQYTVAQLICACFLWLLSSLLSVLFETSWCSVRKKPTILLHLQYLQLTRLDNQLLRGVGHRHRRRARTRLASQKQSWRFCNEASPQKQKLAKFNASSKHSLYLCEYRDRHQTLSSLVNLIFATLLSSNTISSSTPLSHWHRHNSKHIYHAYYTAPATYENVRGTLRLMINLRIFRGQFRNWMNGVLIRAFNTSHAVKMSNDSLRRIVSSSSECCVKAFGRALVAIMMIFCRRHPDPFDGSFAPDLALGVLRTQAKPTCWFLYNGCLQIRPSHVCQLQGCNQNNGQSLVPRVPMSLFDLLYFEVWDIVNLLHCSSTYVPIITSMFTVTSGLSSIRSPACFNRQLENEQIFQTTNSDKAT